MSSDPVRIEVKICGICHQDDLETAEGADMIGIVIDVPGSIRSRTKEEARTLVRVTNGRWRTVAVVVDPTLPKLRELWDEVGVDWIQVHGKLPAGLGEKDRARIVRSIGVAPPGAVLSPGGGPHFPSNPSEYPFIHLDTAGGTLPGGTGKVSDWTLARQLVDDYYGIRFMLSGGLTPSNVSQALDTVHPQAVDVSSGVELRPGTKSRAKVRLFLEQVRRWEAAHA